MLSTAELLRPWECRSRMQGMDPEPHGERERQKPISQQRSIPPPTRSDEGTAGPRRWEADLHALAPPTRTVGKHKRGRRPGREECASLPLLLMPALTSTCSRAAEKSLGPGDLPWFPTGTWQAERNEGAAEGDAHFLWAPGSHRVPAATQPPEDPALDLGSRPRHAGWPGTVSGS